MKRLTITVRDEDERDLLAEAAARRLSISELVRRKIERADVCECDRPELGFVAIGRSNPPFDSMTFREMREQLADDLVAELGE